MEVLDRILGFFEVLAVPATLFWLLRGDLSTRKLLAAIVVAVTVAQPFGIVATPVYNPPDHAKFASPTGVHVLHVLGIPVMPYVVYRRRNIDPATAIGDNGPSMTLRVRSWFWLPVLTNSTEVAAICSTDNSVPC